MLNQVVLVGRLTSDPEVTETESGKKVTTMNIAVQRPFKNMNGLYETDFIKCVLWNNIATNTSEYCKKGDIVGIKGRLETGNYIDKDNKKKYYTEVIAEKVTFLSSSKKNEEKPKSKKRN